MSNLIVVGFKNQANALAMRAARTRRQAQAFIRDNEEA
jgi:hypothetical protein